MKDINNDVKSYFVQIKHIYADYVDTGNYHNIYNVEAAPALEIMVRHGAPDIKTNCCPLNPCNKPET